ncbi:hypothetical protein LCGC14_0809450 [marine sediment metagenome]|uniref:Uncharacterized protein n=1 Tax=marine sediment metagenome TaxID=412755 RepID=A0A0F9PM65_9ZZZZ
MPIRVEYASPGLAGLAGLLGGQGRQAVTDRAEAAKARLLAQQIAGQQKGIAMRSQAQAAISANAQRAASNRQAAALSAQRSSTQQQIRGRAQREMQASEQAFKQMAVRAGLQQELGEQAYDRQIQMLEEQAKQKASQRKQIYSEEGKRTITQGNRLIEWANDMTNDASPEMRRQALQRGQAMAAGVRTVSIPETKPELPPGLQPGTAGKVGDEIFIDGKHIRFEYTREGVQFKAQQEQLKAQQEQREKQETQFKDFYKHFLSEKIPSGEDPVTGKEEFRVQSPLGAYKKAKQAMELLHGGLETPPQEAPVAQEAPPQQAATGAAFEGPWYENPLMKNMPIRESDKRLPDEVGIAMVSLRFWKREYKDKSQWSPKLKLEVAKAEEILRRFREQNPSVSELSGQ